jgi:hypothetical protein
MTTESEKASKLAFVGLITGALCISLAPILVRMSEMQLHFKECFWHCPYFLYG